MASFITANEVLTQRQNGSISRCGGQGDPKIIGRLLDEAAGVDAGRVVAPAGTVNLECQEPNTAALVASAYGFTVFSPMQEDADLTDGTPHYGDNSMVSIMTHGSMYVDCEGTAVAQRPVLVRHTSDGGSNTELGKVSAVSDYPAGGIVATPVAVVAADSNNYSITLFDGVVRERYSFNSDITPSAQEVVEGLAALINAGTAFDATENDVALSITSVTGILEVDGGAQFVLTNPARCAILPGAFFTESRTGAGLVEINYDHRGSV